MPTGPERSKPDGSMYSTSGVGTTASAEGGSVSPRQQDTTAS